MRHACQPAVVVPADRLLRPQQIVLALDLGDPPDGLLRGPELVGVDHQAGPCGARSLDQRRVHDCQALQVAVRIATDLELARRDAVARRHVVVVGPQRSIGERHVQAAGVRRHPVRAATELAPEGHAVRLRPERPRARCPGPRRRCPTMPSWPPLKVRRSIRSWSPRTSRGSRPMRCPLSEWMDGPGTRGADGHADMLLVGGQEDRHFGDALRAVRKLHVADRSPDPYSYRAVRTPVIRTGDSPSSVMGGGTHLPIGRRVPPFAAAQLRVALTAVGGSRSAGQEERAPGAAGPTSERSRAAEPTQAPAKGDQVARLLERRDIHGAGPGRRSGPAPRTSRPGARPGPPRA